MATKPKKYAGVTDSVITHAAIPTITETLAERGTRYGDFATHAQITQDIKKVMHSTPKWNSLSPDMKESLEMVAHKIGRILNGDPEYFDSWVDIEGYVNLVSRELQRP